jgi:hypothetical protein
MVSTTAVAFINAPSTMASEGSGAIEKLARGEMPFLDSLSCTSLMELEPMSRPRAFLPRLAIAFVNPPRKLAPRMPGGVSARDLPVVNNKEVGRRLIGRAVSRNCRIWKVIPGVRNLCTSDYHHPRRQVARWLDHRSIS